MSKIGTHAKRLLAVTLAAVLVLGGIQWLRPTGSTAAAEDERLFMDTSYSFAERAADLVSRLTLEEKAAQIGNNNPSIGRLGVPNYDYWKEGLHGVANISETQTATSFPYSVALASSWDPALAEEVATAISDEARGYNNQGLRGLSYWSPTINLARDPRWGRNHESYGEDVTLTSMFATGFVNGYIGANDGVDGYRKTFATLKHYAANNSEYNRNFGTSDANNVFLREYYTRTFGNIIQNTDIRQVMSSYNRVNGVPASGSTYLLDTLLRKTFGFRGYVTSDCGAIKNMVEDHKWVPEGADHSVTNEEAVYYGLTAGCDMDCGSVYPQNALGAVRSGILSEDAIDKALVRIFTQRFTTGEFDPKEMVPYRSDEYSYANQVCNDAHTQLAEDSAAQSIVLLKNEPATGESDPILPLDPAECEKVVMIGDLATQNLLGGYSGRPAKENISTPKQGVEAILGHEVQTAVSEGVSNDKYICNSRNFKLIKGDEEVILPPTMATGFNGGIRLENNANLGYITANNYCYYPQVDIRGVTGVQLETSGGGDTLQGTVEIHMDSPDGMILAKIPTQQTGGWGNYQYFANEGRVDLGGYEVKDLYLVFTPSVVLDKEVTFNAENTRKIQEADVVIACIGNTGGDSSEGHDRSTIAMPRNQDLLVKKLLELNPRTVVHIQSVGVLEIGKFKEEAPAILWTCFNGQAQGKALARVLFGQDNPTAKLPFTWYADNKQLPTIDDYNLYDEKYANGGWTYMYFTGDVDYPFGYGASYSTYTYSNLKIDKTAYTPNDTLTATVDVTNTSAVDGREVVQLYVSSPLADGKVRPIQQLKTFEKVDVAAGQTKTVTLTLPLEKVSFWSEADQKFIYDAGRYTLRVGPSSDMETALSTTYTMSADYQPRLSVVTADPDKVVLNAMRPDQVLTTDLTATLSDDSFYDLDDGDATVTFASSNEAVATVDADGTVHPVGAGLATITATVKLNGETKTDSFPVAVKNELAIDEILVNGEALPNFAKATTTYYYPVEGETAPTVSVADLGSFIQTEITQATGVPGTATVKVTGGDQSVTYTIHFRPMNTDYVVARFSGAEGRYTASKGTLSCDWIKEDGGQPVDFMTHRYEDLYLNLTLILQNDQEGLKDADCFKSGYIRLRSVDTPNENNIGYGVGELNLHSGVNNLHIPIARLTQIAKTGNIDWTQVDRFRLYIDSTNGYDGPFTMIVQDVMVVDDRYSGTRQHLQALIDLSINEEDYTPASYAAYQEAVAAAQALLDGTGEPVMAGDVDGSGDVTAADALMALQAATGKITLTADQQKRADVDGNEGVTAADALMILQAATGKIVLPSAGGEATDEQIAQAVEDLIAARNALVRAVDKSALQAAIDNPVDESVYTADSVARYKAAVAAAQAVMDDPDATQEEVDAAVRDLANARGRLKKPNTQPVLGTFSQFDKEYLAGAGNFLYGNTLYADWKKADSTPINLDGDRTGLYLIMTMTFNAPEGTDLSACWESATIKLRSADLNGENNYGWVVRPTSAEVTDAGSGVYKIAIPLTKAKDNSKGDMDWATTERIITTTVINGVGDYRTLAAESSLTMTLSGTRIVDSALFDLDGWKAG
ncbi:MAG: glycoside hydrolase family 3 C-terminal domain-containing protein [Acutalibacteraceae bacterium]|jgi:beta-glucosidase